MSLIPFILDLAEELNEFNRNLVTGMDVDDFGFGMYPHELHQQQPARRPRTVSQFYLLPSSAQKRQHPYYRGGTTTKSCCNKAAAAAAAQIPESPEKDNDKESGSASAGNNVAAAAAIKPPAAAYSVVNKNGFQVSMNVKQFSPNELTVKTIDNCIVVEGQHDEKEDGHGVISRHFVRKYMLPKGFDPNEVLSTLSSDGILTVKAPPPPSAPKAEEEQHRMVHIQHTGPAHLSVKEGGGGNSNQKEKTSTTTATIPQMPSQQQEEKQKSAGTQAAVNERNGDANAKEQETEMAEPESASPSNTSPTTTTSATASASATASVEPMLIVANNINATPAGIDAIVAGVVITTEENDVNDNEKENDTDIPMTVSISADIAAGIAAVIPDGAIDSVVVIATAAAEAADEDDGGVNVDGLVAGNNAAGETPTPPPPDAMEVDTTTTAKDIADIPLTEPFVAEAAAGDLVAAAAADVAILLAKNQCENGDAKATAEEISN